jgi:hypothetical protein
VIESFTLIPVALDCLHECLAERENSWSQALLIDASGRRLSSHSIARRLQRWSERVGVDLRPSRLRHTFIFRLALSIDSPLVLARLAGYQDPPTAGWESRVFTTRRVLIERYLTAMARSQTSR